MQHHRGRVLALDFGTKRVGAALSDSTWSIATPLETYVRQAPEADARHYRRLADEEGVERVVVGLPVHLSGRLGQTAPGNPVGSPADAGSPELPSKLLNFLNHHLAALVHQ